MFESCFDFLMKAVLLRPNASIFNYHSITWNSGLSFTEQATGLLTNNTSLMWMLEKILETVYLPPNAL